MAIHGKGPLKKKVAQGNLTSQVCCITCDNGDAAEGPATQHCTLSEHQLHALLAGSPLSQGLSCLGRLELLHLIQVAPSPHHLPAVCPSPAPLAPLDQDLHIHPYLLGLLHVA